MSEPMGDMLTHFVDDVAGGEAVLCLESRKLLLSVRGVRLLKVDEHP